jgi:hypothetical protein
MQAQRPHRTESHARGTGLRVEVVFEDATSCDEARVLADVERLLKERDFGRVSVRVAQAPQDGATVINAAQTRGEARLVKWTQDGTLVPVSTVEAAWGIRRQSVDAARERGEIFSVYVRGQHWYPAEALKLGRTELAAVVKALGEESASSKLVFLLRRHDALGARTPAEAADQGLLHDVLRLARAWGRS